jgi:hypothetical protein
LRLDSGALGGLLGNLAELLEALTQFGGALALGQEGVQLRLLLLEFVAFGVELGASLGEGVQPRLQLGALLLRLRELLHRFQLAGELAVAVSVRLDGFEALARRLELLPVGAQLLDAPLCVLAVVLQKAVLVLQALVLLAQSGLGVVVGACGVARGDSLLQGGLLRAQCALGLLQGALHRLQLLLQRAGVADAIAQPFHRRFEFALCFRDCLCRLADALVAEHLADLLASLLGRVAEKLQLLLARAEAGLKLQMVHAEQLLHLSVDGVRAAREGEPCAVRIELGEVSLSRRALDSIAAVAEFELQLHTHLRAALRPEESEGVYPLAEGACAVQRPQNRFQQGGLARAVRAHNRRNARLKGYLRVGVLAEVLQLQRNQAHRSPLIGLGRLSLHILFGSPVRLWHIHREGGYGGQLAFDSVDTGGSRALHGERGDALEVDAHIA